jgi:signal peptidase I
VADKKSKFREYAEAIVIAVLLALVIRAFIVQAFKIPSGSMIPTLNVGDHILVNKFLFGVKIPIMDSRFFMLRQPRRGDIVVFSFPGNKEKQECRVFTQNIAMRFKNAWVNKNLMHLFKDDCRDFIKRVIGVGGDRIEIKNKKVYVNDIALAEQYTLFKDNNNRMSPVQYRDNFGPILVPRSNFFVMGDNRDGSYDSRFWGFVDMREIKGKAFIIYWSWNNRGNWLHKIRWGRLGKLLR